MPFGAGSDALGLTPQKQQSFDCGRMGYMSDKTTLEEVEVMGEILTPGREFKIDSKQSRNFYIFIRYVVPGDGKDGWIEAKGKAKGDYRAVSLDRVAKVVALPKRRRKSRDGEPE